MDKIAQQYAGEVIIGESQKIGFQTYNISTKFRWIKYFSFRTMEKLLGNFKIFFKIS
jgi:hypothetical protein